MNVNISPWSVCACLWVGALAVGQQLTDVECSKFDAHVIHSHSNWKLWHHLKVKGTSGITKLGHKKIVW